MIFYLIVGFFIAVLNVIVYAEIYRLLFTKHIPRRWTSNIPGNPYAVDRLLTAFFGPFPELNDFNIVLGNFPIGKILIVHGYPPIVRYWGFQVFLIDQERNATNHVMSDAEITLDGEENPIKLDNEWGVQRHNKKFTIVVSDSEHRPSWAKNFIDVGRLSPERKVHLTFRAYCPDHGGAFEAPKLYLLDPEKADYYSSFDQFAESPGVHPFPLGNQERVYGPWSTVQASSSERNRFFQTIIFNVVLILLFSSFFNSAFELALLFSVSTTLTWVLYSKVGFNLAEKRYRKMFEKNFGIPNQKVTLPDPHSSTANNPNHMYFSIPYDVTKNDLLVRGWRKGPFRYTSIHCYYWNSLPVPQFLFDQSIIPDPRTEDLPLSEEKYTIRLTASPNYNGEENIINVSDSPIGICMVRLVYPANEEAVQRCKPTIEVVSKGYKVENKVKTQ